MTLPIAGWYPDPDNSQRSRWWSGAAWTDNYSDYQAPAAPFVAAPVAAAPEVLTAAANVQPAPVAPAVTPPAATLPATPASPYTYAAHTATLTSPAGTSWNTAWIWLIVGLPLLTIPAIFAVNWTGMITATDQINMMNALLSPGYFLALAISVIVYGLSVWFAYLDYRTLTRRAVPRPFHWAWAFLQSGVYPIGRSVVVKRRTGRGISPMWVTIAVLVGSVIFSIIFVVSFFIALVQYSTGYYGY